MCALSAVALEKKSVFHLVEIAFYINIFLYIVAEPKQNKNWTLIDLSMEFCETIECIVRSVRPQKLDYIILDSSTEMAKLLYNALRLYKE